MRDTILLLPILVPFISAILILLIGKRFNRLKEIITLLVTGYVLLITIFLFKNNITYTLPWNVFGIQFSLRLYHFSGFIILAASFFGFLISLYSVSFMRDKAFLDQFYSYFLISLGFINGAVLSDNLGLMFFLWEGLLLTLFGMIVIGNENAFKSATKAFIIEGIAGLFLMLGIGIIWHLTGTLEISKINLTLGGLASAAFIFLMIGAISKTGSMPFHSWIPDAAIDAPLPFMAFLPASLDKLLGIYFLTRISLDIFQLNANSWMSMTLMIIGGVTILLAVMMALIQKDYKKLLSYHAISQAGYMILGIGTCLPAGIIGGIFHMINNALYKSCLFLTSGAVEKQTGTANLEKLGGLGVKMPVTFICFIITALSISGVPPFNGFFSKELIYDAALKRGMIFYIAAVLGSFFTAASFLKLGHAAFLGKLSDENKSAKEVKWPMLLPMIIIAAVCVIFGIYNFLPINKLIQPVLSQKIIEAHASPASFSGMPANMMLVVITVLVLIGAILNHIYGVKKTGRGLGAVDHIHHAPVLSGIYDKADEKYFDPYNIVLELVSRASRILWMIDRAIDWVYNNFSVKLVYTFSYRIRRMHNGNYALYITWALIGAIISIVFIVI